MAQPKPVLKIFTLNQPLLHTEWRSILGDKYCHALPFDYVLTETLEEAQVVAWDGVISLKQRKYAEEISAQLSKGKILIHMGEALTLLHNHPFIKLYESTEVTTIGLNGWSILPEEILAVLEACFKKLNHV